MEVFSTPPKASQQDDRLAFTPDPSWHEGEMKVSTVDVSAWERSHKYVKIISNVLTPKECADLIEISEGRGYEPALVNTGWGQKLMPDVRNNDRCIIDSPISTEFMWQRVLQACPDDDNLLFAPFSGRKLHAVGLNERMRLLRYDPGTYFAPHYDGSYRREAGPREGETSFVTFQLYLNEGFQGGATRLLNCQDESEGFDVVPQTGSVLLFQHDVYHEGAPLREGRKYALRTDVMFTTKGPNHAYANDIDDIEL